MNVRLAIVGTLVFSAVGLPAAVAAKAGIEWSTAIPDALARAADQGKPVLVDVWAVWCAPCKELEETTYRDAEVVRLAAEHVVPLKVDADVHETFLDRHRVDAFPTVLFLDGRGNEIARREGLVSAPDMVELLRALGQGYSGYVASRSKDGDADAMRSAAGFLRSVGNPEGAVELLRRGLKSVKGAEAEVVQGVELALAEARLDAGEDKAAVKAFEALAADGASSSIRDAALAGLVRAERARGRTDEASQALARLRESSPQRAGELENER